jgi:hypothetical protein
MVLNPPPDRSNACAAVSYVAPVFMDRIQPQEDHVPRAGTHAGTHAVMQHCNTDRSQSRITVSLVRALREAWLQIESNYAAQHHERAVQRSVVRIRVQTAARCTYVPQAHHPNKFELRTKRPCTSFINHSAYRVLP